MAIKVATLAVDITVTGIAKAMAGLRGVEERMTKLGKSIKGSLEGTVKLWAAFKLLSSSSAVASTYIDAFQSVLGNLIDSILLPITPILDTIMDGLFAFSDWFANQGPLVKAIALGLGLAFALMWLGVSGPLAFVIAGVAAFAYLWLTSGPKVQGILAVLAVAFGVFWAVATGGIAPLVAGIVLLLGWMLKVTGAWDKIKEAGTWVADKLGISHAGGDAAGVAGVASSSSAAPSTVTTNNYNMAVTTVGNSGGGRDAGIALQGVMAMGSRSV